jgi:hypothetical protein
MWKKRNLFTALAAVAVVVVALTVVLARTGSPAASADAGAFETLLAAKAGISVDTLHLIESAGVAAAADRAVTDGKLSADQGSKLKAVAVSPLLEQAFSDLASATNASEQNLFDGLAGGQSLAQVAAANGVDATTLKDRLSKLALTDIDSAVTMGVASQDQAVSAKAAVNDANLTKLINATLPQHEGGQR